MTVASMISLKTPAKKHEHISLPVIFVRPSQFSPNPLEIASLRAQEAGKREEDSLD